MLAMALSLHGIAIAGLLLFALGLPPGASAQDLDAQELATAEPLPGRAIGEASAPVTVIEYASLSCHHCARFHTRTWPTLKSKYVDTGHVRFIFREFPLNTLALAATMLTRCIEDDKWYELLDRLYQTQETWTHSKQPVEALAEVAAQAGMTQPQFDRCLDDKSLVKDIVAFARRGLELGVSSTPTFFVNGQKHVGALTIEDFEKVLEPMLTAEAR
jgi:protein-disulfide isomerase